MHNPSVIDFGEIDLSPRSAKIILVSWSIIAVVGIISSIWSYFNY